MNKIEQINFSLKYVVKHCCVALTVMFKAYIKLALNTYSSQEDYSFDGVFLVLD